MPYNNAPIAPTEEITGSSALPLARVKKIIAQDEDISQCSNSAAFAISVATEIFIRYLTEQAHNVVKSERKPRRNIAYKDIATAVARIDNLEFLSDVVPKTTTNRRLKEAKAQQEEASSKARPGSANGVNGDGGSRSIEEMMHQQQPETNGILNGPVTNGSAPHSPMADRTAQHAHPQPHPVRDLEVEMTG